jgi:hypothetical protein
MATNTHIREYSFHTRIWSPLCARIVRWDRVRQLCRDRIRYDITSDIRIEYQCYTIRMSEEIKKSLTRQLLQHPSRRLRTPILRLGLSDQSCQACACLACSCALCSCAAWSVGKSASEYDVRKLRIDCWCGKFGENFPSILEIIIISRVVSAVASSVQRYDF